MKITIQQRQQAWSTLTSAGDRARRLTAETTEKIDEIRRSEVWAEKHKDDLVEKLRQALAAQLDQISADAVQARDLLLAAAGELEQPAGDPTAQLLAETRQTAAWTRAKALLDTGRSHHEILTAAAQRGDGDTINALRRELPAWVEAKQHRPGGTLNLTVQQPDMAGLRRALDVATARTLGDDKAAGTAASLRLHAETMHPVAEATVALMRRGRGDLGAALHLRYAEKAAEQVRADLGETDAGSGDAA